MEIPPPLQESVKGFCTWVAWQCGFLVYQICIALPIALFITTLFFIGIARVSSPSLSITMAALLHPVVTLPIAILIYTTRKLLWTNWLQNRSKILSVRILSRLLTYSLNCHLALIAGLTLYLFELWKIFKDSTSLNFNNKPFNQCLCNDILPQYNVTCTNEEAGNSFQNKFLHIPINSILICFLLTAISCHLIQSLFIALPEPLPLLNFVLGNEQMQNFENKWKDKSFYIFKIIGAFIGIVYIAILVSSPYYTFTTFQGEGKHTNKQYFLP